MRALHVLRADDGKIAPAARMHADDLPGIERAGEAHDTGPAGGAAGVVGEVEQRDALKRHGRSLVVAEVDPLAGQLARRILPVGGPVLAGGIGLQANDSEFHSRLLR